jgi:hypothetical protein
VSDKLPQEIIDHWPEVFQDIEIKAIPIEYIRTANVYFDNGDMWEIDIQGNFIEDHDSAEEALELFFEEYDDSIVKVDFKIDSEKVINDVKTRTKTFMKKRK